MALKNNWNDLVDGESFVEVEPINRMAHAIIANEENILIVQNLGKSIQADNESQEARINELSEDLIRLENNSARLDSKTSENEKRITNLERGIPSDLFLTDNSIAYSKDVPQNALPYAEVRKIGGMTYKDGGTLRSAPVTEVESVGVNLAQVNTLPIPEAVQALDGYGDGVNDSVYNYIDYEKKQFVKRVGKVDLGTCNWDYSSADKRFFIKTTVMPTVSNEKVLNALCEMYTPISFNNFYADVTRDNTISRTGGEYLFVRNLSYADAATFKAAMSGVMLYYELATPVVTDISHLVSEDNFIGVEGNGTITMINQYKYNVPSEIVFMLNEV